MNSLLVSLLDWKFSFKIRSRQVAFPVPSLLSLVFTLAIFGVFLHRVELKPQIGSNFFFSSDDPQMQEEKKIQALFPQDPQLVFSVRGEVESAEYLERIRSFSQALEALPQVISVQSLSHGPGDFKKAREGPLWSRILISEDGRSSLLAVFIEDINPETFIPEIEKVVKKYHEPNFEILVSGEPYIVELLRRGLFEDLKKFSVAAFLVFGFLFLFFFRSVRILIGTLITCANASMITLILSQAAGIEIGILTANLSTIVFVLTLSHLIFILFNWRDVKRNEKMMDHPSLAAIRMTFPASLWSMLTTCLGFLSLLFVKAAPLRQLGASGAVGTVMAFIAAYVFFPLFLYQKNMPAKKLKHEKQEKKIEPFFYRRHLALFVVLAIFTLVSAIGMVSLNTDPSLLAYFKEESSLRKGLEYIDRNGGSSPLFIVVHDPAGAAFNQKEGYEKLWDATQALEEDAQVGSAVSLPVIIAQAEKNIIAKILTVEWLIDLLETNRFGRVAEYFVTKDRTKALIMLRMREMEREVPRVQVIRRLEQTIEKTGLWPFLTGGVYSLQGRMSQLIASSLISGLCLLLFLFFLMGWAISRNWKIACSLLISLCMIPSAILGFLGYLKIPLDVISSPAVNIAIGMAVDAMIHMLIYVRGKYPDKMTEWSSWKSASLRYWRPILYTTIIIGSGFGIFGLSDFPPTQRFGLMVVVGAFMAPCAALISLPTLVRLKFKRWV